ncbi:MAG TPA: hemerythrin domain-containing protein [Rhizomicrobium sp.]|nr:hemerythrin domain-containing protein [Rhizomicrobium sp.]
MTLLGTIKRARRTVGHAVKGTEPGPEEIDILDTLKKEHEEASELLQKLVDSDKAAERKSILKKLKAALAPHLKAEDQVVYKAVMKLKGKKEKQDGNEGEMEHALASQMLVKLTRISNATSPEFSAAAKVLKELVEHHVEEEERNIWSDVKENFSDEDRYAMNVAFEAAKKKVKIPA